ncbi:MAG: insulinase family protein [Crocinitomicaceae bacterium]|nr:insulinase family protein [Flavobacteriales bacterium]NQZ34131.1 insulinase family protein [Crocinitomicaceae bacterium]
MKKYIIALGLFVPTILFGQIDRSIRPEAAPAPTINIKDSKVFTTENGITVILSENHKIPRVSYNLVMGSDPKLEKSKAGLSSIAGTLVMSGTSNRSKDDLDNEVDNIGATLHADNNSIYMSSLTKHMTKGLTLMSDVLMNANFPQSEVDRIITQNESNLTSTKSDAGSMASNATSSANFPKGHPYGEIMTFESLENIDRSSIVEYYNMAFSPKGSYLVVVGDITLEETKELVQTYFGNWKGKAPHKENWGTGSFNTGNNVSFVNKPGAVQSVISVSFSMAITPSDPDYLKLKVLNNIMGAGGFASRLMQNLREDKAYTYGCYSRLNITDDGSWFSAGGNFRNEVTDSAITQILFELDRIIDDYVTDKELDLAKSSMAGSFGRSLERPSTVARFALNIIKNDLPKDYYQTYLKQLEAITKQDLLDVAQKYWTGSKCNIVVVGNEEVIPTLLQFDSDGEIEELDAFGNEVVEKIPSDLTADEIIENYLAAVIPNVKAKKRKKIFKKIKSMEVVIEMTSAQVPFPITSKNAWMSPNINASLTEGKGMVFSSSYSDGITGQQQAMGIGKSEMTPEEIAVANKSMGIVPEYNYGKSGMEYEVIGIEKFEKKECYVLKLNDGKSITFDYYDRTSFMKLGTMSIETQGEETTQATQTYDNYVEMNGILFPTVVKLSTGQANLEGKVVSRIINGEIDFESYKK